MPAECAFCPSTAKLSGEHLWSDWMNALFPGEKIFRNVDEHGVVTKSWSGMHLNWKAKVVCEPCNNTWMSQIEESHAKPAMIDLIPGKILDIPIPQSRANSIAIFAFKAAVVVDQMIRGRRPPFFPRSARHRFKETLDIPHNVRMWLTGLVVRGHGRIVTIYNNVPTANHVELYICNYVVGRLVLQVVADSGPPLLTVFPKPGFEDLAIPFWPHIPNGFVWPADVVLHSIEDFNRFALRWQRVTFANPTLK